jgi:hypothetical protein
MMLQIRGILELYRALQYWIRCIAGRSRKLVRYVG